VDSTPIPKEVLERARRVLCRRMGACVVSAMADTDTDFATIAARLSTSERVVSGWLDTLISGSAISLDKISDLLFAMGAEMEFSIIPANPSRNPKTNRERPCRTPTENTANYSKTLTGDSLRTSRTK